MNIASAIHRGGSTGPHPAPSFATSASLVATREITMRLRSKSFLISSAILLLAVLGSIVAGAVFSAQASSSTTTVAFVQGARVDTALPGVEPTMVSTVGEAEKLVRDGTVQAAVIPSDGPTGVAIVGLDDVPGSLVQQFTQSPEVTLLSDTGTDSPLTYLVAIAFGVIFFMAATVFGTSIAQSVVEEKQTRIVEILMSAISARALLAGKVIGNALLAFAQILLIAIVAGIGLVVTKQNALLAQVGPSILIFVLFFAIGFILLAAMYAAAASLVSRQEDIGSVTTPVMMLVMIPYFMIIFFYNNPLILTIMSYVPFSAPIAMPMRVFLGTAEWWEPVVSIIVIVAATAVVVVFGSKIYANSLLRTGARVKIGDALRG